MLSESKFEYMYDIDTPRRNEGEYLKREWDRRNIWQDDGKEFSKTDESYQLTDSKVKWNPSKWKWEQYHIVLI